MRKKLMYNNVGPHRALCETFTENFGEWRLAIVALYRVPQY